MEQAVLQSFQFFCPLNHFSDFSIKSLEIEIIPISLVMPEMPAHPS